MRDLMLDFETWGLRPGCAIRSVGAVMFDPTGGELGPTFYRNVDDESCRVLGLTRTPSTVTWWESAKMRDAAKVFEEDPQPIVPVMSDLNRFFYDSGATRIWSQGANFDEPIAVHIFEKMGMQAPWKFWDSRCTRTIYAAAGLNYNREPRAGTAHNALDDARHQARLVQKSYKMLKINH